MPTCSSDPIYQSTVVNTLLFLGIAVNLKMFCALLMSGFFMRRGWWVKALLMIYVLPWAVPALPTFISIHWMLNGEWGLINNVIYQLFHARRPVLARLHAGSRSARRSTRTSGSGCRSGR